MFSTNPHKATMHSHCLSFAVPLDLREILYGVTSTWNMLGSEEEEWGNELRVRAFFGTPSALGAAEHGLMSLPVIGAVHVYAVPDEDWNRVWRENMEPVRIAPGVWVSPSWLTPPLESGEHWIKIEPRMAFGTGHHETTRLSANAIVAECTTAAQPPSRMLDIGSGTGVLCLVGDFYGVEHCTGLEHDVRCVESMAETLRDNPSRGRVDLAVASLESLKASTRFDLIVMNIILALSAPLLPTVKRLLAPEGRFIWSGMFDAQRDKALQAAAASVFTLGTESREGEWWCGVFGG